MDKQDYLTWASKYDKNQGWATQKEKELGARFRRLKTMSKTDLIEVVKWKSNDDTKRDHILELVSRNDEATVRRISSQVFSMPEDDACRINCLLMLEGISPVLASVILAFFDPKRYGIFDSYVWKSLLGNEPPNLYSTVNYLRLLTALRKTAAKHGLDVRLIEKALFKMRLDELGSYEHVSQRRRSTKKLRSER